MKGTKKLAKTFEVDMYKEDTVYARPTREKERVPVLLPR